MFKKNNKESSKANEEDFDNDSFEEEDDKVPTPEGKEVKEVEEEPKEEDSIMNIDNLKDILSAHEMRLGRIEHNLRLDF